MKKLLLCVAILFLTTFSITAQEDEAVQGTYIQTAENGSFWEEDGVTYLTLEAVPESILWTITTPTFRGGVYETLSFVGDWGFATENLSTDGILTTENESIKVILSQPEYDSEAGTVTYVVTVEEIVPFDEDAKDPITPETFETATLFIYMDNDFYTALRDGMVARINSTRGSNITSCKTDPYCDD